MSQSFDELTGMIRKMVLDIVRYNVPRLGQVSKIDDETSSGRILVLIPVLGWDTDNLGAWCFPKDKKSLITPKVGDYVYVEFIDGDRNQPVYSGIANGMKDMLPKNYDGKPTTQIIFEDNSGKAYVKYDEKEKEFLISDSSGNKVSLKDGVLKIFSGTESFLKGDTFDAWVTSALVNAFNLHVHSGVTTGPGFSGIPATPRVGPSNHLSTTIKGE